jgi:cytochrome c oxidase assembly factor CtaG
MLSCLQCRRTRALLVALALVPLGGAAHAHTGSLDPRLLDWRWETTQWSWDPWVLGAMAVVAVSYAIGASSVASRKAIWAFASAMAWLILALVSPLDTLAGDLFSVHMAQHMILLLVAAPPLVASRMPLVLFWALPAGARKAMARGWLARPAWRGAMLFLEHPITVWLLSALALIFWHLPGPYGWAMGNRAVHTVEHLTFLLTAYGFWSIVMQTGRRRLDYGMSIVFVGTLATIGGLLGAILTFARHPLYAAHLVAAPALGLPALQDQQLAGLIMWIPASFAYLAAIVWLFHRWLNNADEMVPNLGSAWLGSRHRMAGTNHQASWYAQPPRQLAGKPLS